MFTVVNARVLHEGAHCQLTNYPRLNAFLALIYANPCLCRSSWELQHVISHHAYTNYLPEDPNGGEELCDLDATNFESVEQLGRWLNLSRPMWKLALCFIVPFSFLYIGISVGLGKAITLIQQQSL